MYKQKQTRIKPIMAKHYVVIDAGDFEEALELASETIERGLKMQQVFTLINILGENGSQYTEDPDISIESENVYMRLAIDNFHKKTAFDALSRLLVTQEKLNANDYKEIELWANIEHHKLLEPQVPLHGEFDIRTNIFRAYEFDTDGVTNLNPQIPGKVPDEETFVLVIDVWE